MVCRDNRDAEVISKKVVIMLNLTECLDLIPIKPCLTKLVDSFAFSSILFLLFFMPQEYAIGEAAFQIWQYAQMAELLFAGVAFIVLRHRPSARWALLCLFYCSFYLLSSIANWTLSVVPSNIYECLRGIGFITISEIYIQRNMRQYIGSFGIAGLIMCTGHIISEILISSGAIPPFEVEPGASFRIEWQTYYLLTYDNESVYFFLPTILALFIYGSKYRRTALYFGIALLVFATCLALYHKALTASIAYLVLIILLSIIAILQRNGVLSKFKKMSRREYSIGLILALVISGLFVGLVVSGCLGTIAEILGKDADFSMRDEIWRKALHSIMQHPVMGRGREGFNITREVIGQTHCHNLILELMYTGGALTALSFILGVIFCFPKEVYQNKQNTQQIKFALSITAFICAFFVVSNLDWYPAIVVQFFIFESLCICEGRAGKGRARHMDGFSI